MVDDGESGVEEAKRTHPDYQGQGLMKTLDRYAKEKTLQRHPGIKRWKIGTYQRHIVNSLLNAPNSMYWVQERKVNGHHLIWKRIIYNADTLTSYIDT